MTLSIAQRRALKATRRRKTTAKEPRRGSDDGAAISIASVRRWAAAPIDRCLVPQRLFEIGVGTMVLARQKGAGELAVGAFLVDVYCCGIKDALFHCLGHGEFEYFLDLFAEAGEYERVEPSYARKLLRDLGSYAQSLGFAPHRDFAAVEALFGEVRAEACDTTFRFGCSGKPRYIAGPYDTPQRIRSTLKGLRKRLGEDGFDYIVPASDIELADADFLGELLLEETSSDEIPF
jgi:hypothetical protein